MPYDFQLIRAVEYIAFSISQAIPNSLQAKAKLAHYYDTCSRVEITYTPPSNTRTRNTIGVYIEKEHPFSYQEWLEYVVMLLTDAIDEELSCDLHFNHVEFVEWLDENGEIIETEQRGFVPITPVSSVDDYKLPQQRLPPRNMKELADAHKEFIYTPKDNFDEYDWDLELISPLKLLGYTVGNDGMSSMHRQAFLSKFFKIYLPETVQQYYRLEWGEPFTKQRLEKMIRHIKANIFRTGGNASLRKATEDWQEDVDFLQDVLRRI